MAAMKEYVGKILMLVEDYYPADVRVRNEAVTLTKAGYKITIISLRKKGQPAKEKINEVGVYRIPKLELFQKSSKKRDSSILKLYQTAKSFVVYLI